MRRDERDGYDAWLSGELLLFGLLGAALALFIDSPSLRHAWESPSLALVLDTTITLAGGIVAVLAGIRFAVEGRRFDLLLSAGLLRRRGLGVRVRDRSRPRRPRSVEGRELGGDLRRAGRDGPDRRGAVRSRNLDVAPARARQRRGRTAAPARGPLADARHARREPPRARDRPDQPGPARAPDARALAAGGAQPRRADRVRASLPEPGRRPQPLARHRRRRSASSRRSTASSPRSPLRPRSRSETSCA